MNMNRIFVLLTLMGLAVFINTQAVDANSHNHTSHAELSEMGRFIHDQMIAYVNKSHIPNAVMAIVTANGETFMKGYGQSSLHNGEPTDPEKHLFRTGSVSKIFAWTAVMQLYERGLVDLDEDINTYLDVEFNHRILYKGDEAPISLRHLLNHTAGFEDVLQNLFSFSPQPALREQLLDMVPARIFPPGEVMAYSNWGTSLTGYIVECVTGLSFEDYVEQYIFEPLGMMSSSFRQPLPDDLKKNFVTAYRWVDGTFMEGHFEYMAAPAGGVSTTARDMLLFLHAQLNGGENEYGRFMDASTLQSMHTNSFSYHPLTAGVAHGLLEWYKNGQRIIWHGGSSTVFDSGFYLLPEAGLGLFFAYSGGSYTGHARIMHKFMDAFFPQKVAHEKDYEPLLAKEIAQLEGFYQQSRMMRTSSDKMLNLVMGSLQLRATSENIIEFSLYDEDYIFEQVVPGVFRRVSEKISYPFGPLDYLVVGKAPNGRTMLIVDGPMTFMKTSWHETPTFAALIFIPSLFLAFTVLLFLNIRLVVKKVRRSMPDFNAETIIINRVMGFHAAAFLLSLILFMVTAQPHPVHQLPKSFFEPNQALDLLISMGLWITGILSVALLVMMIWRVRVTGFRPLPSFIVQGLYTLWAVALVWLLQFYTLIGF
ncbi:MAG: class A beta-lactamase-related serine hydrolase [Bacteroidetes bacterium]|nr:MAG: class A beta-lactamase-related serine hydrolase [Bacteroidota bacterium]